MINYINKFKPILITDPVKKSTTKLDLLVLQYIIINQFALI